MSVPKRVDLCVADPEVVLKDVLALLRSGATLQAFEIARHYFDRKDKEKEINEWVEYYLSGKHLPK